MIKKLEANFTITNPTFTYRVNLGEGYQLEISARDEHHFVNQWFSTTLKVVNQEGSYLKDLTNILRKPDLFWVISGKRIPITITVDRGYLDIHESLYVGGYIFTADLLDQAT